MTESRTIEEAYTTATTSSDLRVEADRRGDADVLIAAGWCPTRIGSALLRLRSEWDATARAPTATAAQFLVVGKVPGNARERAQAKAEAGSRARAHNLHEAALQLARCKSLPGAREQLTSVATQWGVEGPKQAASDLLRWWLSPTCPGCHGTRYEAVVGTGRLSAKVCKVCRGTGTTHTPQGEAGKRLAIFMDDCTQRARESIGRRLRMSTGRG